LLLRSAYNLLANHPKTSYFMAMKSSYEE